MKKLLLALTAFISSLSATVSEEQKIKVEEPRDFTYVSSGSFSWACIPAGVNLGLGQRWYGESFAFGTSLNVSASLSVTPFVDLLLEGLYFVDPTRYVGIQLGMGVGKPIIKDLDFKIKDTYYEYRSPKWVAMPIVKFIPFGREWSHEGRKQFMHVAVFPVGVSFNYGWEM